jgi:hypothetical protein
MIKGKQDWGECMKTEKKQFIRPWTRQVKNEKRLGNSGRGG